MISDNLKRIEELRYNISRLTFEFMKRKASGETDNQLSNLKDELNSMKSELANHLSLVQDAGYVYIMVNKKRIDDLKSSFAGLSEQEKLEIFNEKGRGFQILQDSLFILKQNREKKEEISNLILSLPADQTVVSKIKNVLEGFSEHEKFKLESTMSASRIAAAIRSIGFFATNYENEVEIAKSEPIFNDKLQAKKDILLPEREIGVKEQANEPIIDIEEAAEQPAAELKIVQTQSAKPELTGSQSKLASEDLQPSLTYEEVCEKIDQILNNYKMKRWVLGAFKDDEEKKEYEKFQNLLVKLMRLKQSMEETEKE
jgi:iron-sulfur cluster repair protein YtfE (RIC family)